MRINFHTGRYFLFIILGFLLTLHRNRKLFFQFVFPMKKIRNALISVYSKDRIDIIVQLLHDLDIVIYSTGGTYEFIRSLGLPAIPVENLTNYPSILGGRVKTLHPKVFGGILARRENTSDQEEVKKFEIPYIDLVIVDLYPFEETAASVQDEEEIIEKIDIGGISLIRAAAKNFHDVIIVPSANQYGQLIGLLKEKSGYSSLEDRLAFATAAFDVSSHYDSAIYRYFSKNGQPETFKESIHGAHVMRYGENPHQKGIFYGNLDVVFNKLHGKEISYNNLLDLDAAVHLIHEFEETAFAILKHNNACGAAIRDTLIGAWKDALAGDPVSAFGGVLVTNRVIDEITAKEIDKLFFEIILAKGFENNALELLKSKKNRIILQAGNLNVPAIQYRSVLNGALWQEKDTFREKEEDLRTVTKKTPLTTEFPDLLFANILVKHSKSNAIVLAKNRQLIASGAGQTSRVDALKQAIMKAAQFGFDLKGAVMASDAFFPFPDCVEIAHDAGITAVIQPGGSVKDKDSIAFCDDHNMAMVFTGIRHFKH